MRTLNGQLDLHTTVASLTKTERKTSGVQKAWHTYNETKVCKKYEVRWIFWRGRFGFCFIHDLSDPFILAEHGFFESMDSGVLHRNEEEERERERGCYFQALKEMAGSYGPRLVWHHHFFLFCKTY